MIDNGATGGGRGAADQAKARDLARVKRAAALALAAAGVVFVAARLGQGRWPALSFLAAFAEAAMIGGLADWYAVVALFRHPLGLKIPHTAIVPENQGKIAEKLGEFIETQFLAADIVGPKLREIDFAAFAARWLDDPGRAGALARFLLKLAPEALDAAGQSGARVYFLRRLLGAAQGFDIAPLMRGAARAFVAGDRHQKILDELLTSLSTLMDRPEMTAALRARIRDELPTLLALYRADAFLLTRILRSTHAFFDEVRGDPDHPFRAEFDRFLKSWLEEMTNSPESLARFDALRRELLARPETRELARRTWGALREFVEAAARGDNPALEAHIAHLLVTTGRQLAADPAMRREINEGVVMVLSGFVEAQKSEISRFVADQVKSWNLRQLVDVIEINVGRDLQFIRFNGMIVGGAVGVLLHALERATGLL